MTNCNECVYQTVALIIFPLSNPLGFGVLRRSRLWHPASLYLVHPWTRTTCIPVGVPGGEGVNEVAVSEVFMFSWREIDGDPLVA